MCGYYASLADKKPIMPDKDANWSHATDNDTSLSEKHACLAD